ncbi:hypothetical protein ACHAXT_003996 [Thalassiosira profunda]
MAGDDRGIMGGGEGGGGNRRGVEGTPETDNERDHNDNEGGNLLFSCQCESARSVATLLSCLRRVVTGGSAAWNPSASGSGSGHTQSATQRGAGTQATTLVSGGSAAKIQHATVYAGPNGLTFHVQHGLARQSQCSVDMPRGLFREYFVGEEEVWLDDSDTEQDDDEGTHGSQGGGRKEIIQGGEFGVNLTTVLECFSILSKNRDTMTKAPTSGGGGGGTKAHLGEYASLAHVPLCMSYDRGTATFHLEFLEGGSLSTAGDGAAANSAGGCLVTCEVPGVAVADDVDDGPDDLTNNESLTNNNSGLAAAFRSSPLLSRAILYSDALQSAVSELYDVPGASIVQVALSKKGMELGTVGPRSEVWVDVPYHRGQQGMYVGLECYTPNVPLFGSLAASSNESIVRKYPLGAFLSGMRGLDIGLETCVSVNARGMMAIQHQISRDGYRDYSEEGNGGKGRPSFVDFIMTCIEEDGEEEDGGTMGASQDASLDLPQHGGLHDITNDRRAEAREAAARPRAKGRAKKAARADESSSEEEEERVAPKTRGRGKQRKDDADGDSGDEHEYQDAEPAGENVLGELDLDQDMMSSHKNEGAAAGKRRQSALEDIRRRRREQRQQPRDDNSDDDNEDAGGTERRESNDSSGKKRRARDDADGARAKNSRGRHANRAQDSQSQSEEGGSSEESEHEDSLDVTADVSHLYSKRSSLSASRHGSMDGGGSGSEDEAEEPRMMYGDTKLEFTQDSYESD